MSKHTLGQWKLHDMESNIIVGNDHITIADVNARNKTQEENQANAQLIAAAPDLLEACKDLVSRATMSEETMSIFIKAKQAIKKAEGV